MKLEGIVKEGKGRATQTTAKQKPFFKQKGLKGVDKLRDGTINIDISPSKFTILNYDYFFDNIKYEKGKTEDFGFIEVEEIIYDDQVWKKPGYIYIPHKSPHFQNKSQMEVMSVEIPKIKSDEPIILEVEEDKLALYLDLKLV